MGKDDKRQVPWLAIIVTAVLSCLLFLSGDYIFLVSCVVLISLIQYIPTALSVMHFQKTKSPGWNVPGGKVIPIIVVLLCVYLATGVSFKVWLLIIVMLVIGTAFYLLDDHKKS
ncbi:APC family permease [Lentilactobacillus kosonis]|uniref:Amino acid permease n=1 Tax=Lentilactobacillus kosonis TaxID=2810561 RepID=A0A401FMX4_9LACO|nr:APC family permease [Lentilactobacillus kosonis]GAY73683.1 amino acid permease [Lentilactobacillus kosonis]